MPDVNLSKGKLHPEMLVGVSAVVLLLELGRSYNLGSGEAASFLE